MGIHAMEGVAARKFWREAVERGVVSAALKKKVDAVTDGRAASSRKFLGTPASRRHRITEGRVHLQILWACPFVSPAARTL